MLSRLFGSHKRDFDDLSTQEVLALAISAEEDDARIYRAYASGLEEEFPHSAKVFEEMAVEEDGHRQMLIERHRAQFGERIPLIRREHVKGFYERKPDWLSMPLDIEKVRLAAERMEKDAQRFYEEAVKRTDDAATRKLLGDLAAAEKGHASLAAQLGDDIITDDIRNEEDEAAHKQFVLTYVQPGLAGFMDGSISTLAPIFAVAFATQDTWTTFLVGLAASVGAGISMGFTEVASDDGVISGRGSPIKRGLTTGLATMVGGLGHALPYLIPDFWTATSIAFAIVFIELWVIVWIQNKYMETPIAKGVFQVVLGGALVFAAGILIGVA